MPLEGRHSPQYPLHLIVFQLFLLYALVRHVSMGFLGTRGLWRWRSELSEKKDSPWVEGEGTG